MTLTDKEKQKLGKKIIDHMDDIGMEITTFNIVYIEGVDPVDEGFRVNADIMDLWNDTRNVIRDDGTILMSAIATTEPGFYYTRNPMNLDGAARIAFGQYLNAWEIGIHGNSYPHESLCQCASVKFYRDLNQDGLRVGDRLFSGIIGLNQHTTSNAPETIGAWSAGCLVGRYPSTHEKFMSLMRESGRSTFHTAIFDGSKLHELGILSEV